MCNIAMMTYHTYTMLATHLEKHGMMTEEGEQLQHCYCSAIGLCQSCYTSRVPHGSSNRHKIHAGEVYLLT